MIDRGKGGAIVLTSSIADLNGIGGNTPGRLACTPSKHAVVGLMRLGEPPGLVQHPGQHRAPHQREPVDISNAIVFLVSDGGRYVTCVTLPVDTGFTNKK